MRQRINDALPSWITVGYGLVYLRTDRFNAAIDRVAASRRFWNIWHTIGIGVTGILFLIMSLLTVFGTYSTATEKPAPSPKNNPANVVAVPGVNDAIPLAIWPTFLLAIIAIIVVHEVGHAIAAAVADIGREDMGLLFLGPIPLGAFVELKHEELAAASVLDRLRVACAGIMNNVALAGVVTPALLARERAIPALIDAYVTALRSGGATVRPILEIDPLTNLLFLVWALGLNVALVNAIPALPLDGGHVMRAIVGWATEATGVAWERDYTGRVTLSTRGVVSAGVSIVVLASWVLMLFGPHFW